MSYQANSPDNRRLSSFRIDDILAPRAARSETSTRTLNPCTARSPPTSPQYQQNLSFGVEQILTRNDKEHKGRTLPYLGVSSVAHGACDHLHSTFWRSPYLTTHAQPYLYGSLHSSCDTCYDYGAYSYMNDAFAALYSDYNSAVISKSQLTGQPLAGQPKPRKPRRPWTRAVFSNLQRKGLEKRFQVQKYLTKADRHQLASMLGLSDNQVKVWFQNRRMKWRQEARETVASGSSEEAEKQK